MGKYLLPDKNCGQSYLLFMWIYIIFVKINQSTNVEKYTTRFSLRSGCRNYFFINQKEKVSNFYKNLDFRAVDNIY